MGNISHLKEKIYLLCYPGPLSKAEISRILYNKRNKRLYTLTSDLDGNWWDIFEIDNIPENLKENFIPRKKDGRLKASKYCYAKPEILMESIVDGLVENSVYLEDKEYDLILSFISSDGFREYVSKHLEKYEIRTYPNDFYPLKLALGQTFYIHYRINEMITTELGEHMDKIRGFQQKHSIPHNLLPGLEDEIGKFSPDLIKKMACLTPGGYHEIKYMFDVICKLTKDLDKITD